MLSDIQFTSSPSNHTYTYTGAPFDVTAGTVSAAVLIVVYAVNVPVADATTGSTVVPVLPLALLVTLYDVLGPVVAVPLGLATSFFTGANIFIPVVPYFTPTRSALSSAKSELPLVFTALTCA